MNYHSGYTGGTGKKVLTRILCVIGSLSVVCALTFAYGNYLKSKAYRTSSDHLGAGRTHSDDVDVNTPKTEFSPSVQVKSMFFDHGNFKNAEESNGELARLAQNQATGMTAILIDREGYLTYSSEAVSNFTKQKSSEQTDLSFLSSAVSYAKSLSLRTSAVIFTSDISGTVSSEIEALVCADAASCGFDEIILVLPIKAEEINSQTSKTLLEYIGKIADRKNNSLLGVCFGTDIYSTAPLSPQVELFTGAADFLCVDLRPVFDVDSGINIDSVLDKTSGSFSVYGLRSLIEGDDPTKLSEVLSALQKNGFENYISVSIGKAQNTADTAEITQSVDNINTDGTASEGEG